MNITTRTIAASMLALTLQVGVTAVFPVTVLASEASVKPLRLLASRSPPKITLQSVRS